MIVYQVNKQIAYINKFKYSNYDLIQFLDESNLLKQEIKNKIVFMHYRYYSISPKLIKLLPFFIMALRCREINAIFDSQVKSLRIFKNRAQNYYCEDLVKKLISIFGNRRAWDEFNIKSKWKPKFKFTKLNYYYLPCTSLIKCCQYKDTIIAIWNESPMGSDMHKSFDDRQIACIKNSFYNVQSGLVPWRSKRKINMILNGSAKDNDKYYRKNLLSSLDTIKQLLGEDTLTADGVKLYKDLNMLSIMR